MHPHLESPFQPSIKPSFQASIISRAVKKGVLARIKGRTAIHWLSSHLRMQLYRCNASLKCSAPIMLADACAPCWGFKTGTYDDRNSAAESLTSTLWSLSSN